MPLVKNPLAALIVNICGWHANAKGSPLARQPGSQQPDSGLMEHTRLALITLASAYGFVIYWCKFSPRLCLFLCALCRRSWRSFRWISKGYARHLIDVYVEHKCAVALIRVANCLIAVWRRAGPLAQSESQSVAGAPCHCHRCQKFGSETFFNRCRWCLWSTFCGIQQNVVIFSSSAFFFSKRIFLLIGHTDWIDIHSYLVVSALLSLAANAKTNSTPSNQSHLKSLRSIIQAEAIMRALAFLSTNNYCKHLHCAIRALSVYCFNHAYLAHQESGGMSECFSAEGVTALYPICSRCLACQPLLYFSCQKKI